MSAAGFLEKLLDGGEVAWKPLGEVVGIQRGRRLVRSQLEEIGKFAVFQNSMKPLGFYHDSNVEADTAFVICAGAAGEIGYSASKFWAADDVHFFQTPNWIISKYVYHWLLTQRSKISSQVRRASIPRLSKSVLESLDFPIPCPDDPQKSLAIQREIVRILDTFTELAAELAAELAQRKKQYNHYREQLLTFDEDNVDWKTLGDVTLKSYSGATPKAGNPKYYAQGTIPWLRTQEVVFSDIHETNVKITQAAVDETAAKWVPENCVIIAISGATAGRSAINKIPLTTNQHCCCLAIDPSQANYRYVFHWVSRNYETLRDMGQGARGDLNSGLIKGFKIPIPFADDSQKSLAEQARIASILDTFDTLTTSIAEGLPREIELREKQYAYYRDQLLSFRKPDAEAA
nr:restriction endonuclease subunit S [Brucella anthropi]